MKIALVHDYLTVYGGGERMLELFHEIYPHAPVYTLLYTPSSMPECMRTWDIHSSFLQKFPFKSYARKLYVPCMPTAIESLHFENYDLVLSISAGFAKGIITPVSTCHISYTLTVPRFLWGYETSTQVRHQRNIALPFINNYLRIWDKVASDRVDYFLANSATTKKRIAKSYARNAKVIYSPVDESFFTLSTIPREDFYLIVSRMEPYKHIELAIQTCLKYKRKLKIIGDGPQRRYLEDIAQGQVDFLGLVDDHTLLRHYNTAKALLFPGADDLGLVPIEAQLCGTPVIAYAKDGALETIVENQTGIYFSDQSEDDLYGAMVKIEGRDWNPEEIRKQAMKFSKKNIKYALKHYIEEVYKEYKTSFSL